MTTRAPLKVSAQQDSALTPAAVAAVTAAGQHKDGKAKPQRWQLRDLLRKTQIPEILDILLGPHMALQIPLRVALNPKQYLGEHPGICSSKAVGSRGRACRANRLQYVHVSEMAETERVQEAGHSERLSGVSGALCLRCCYICISDRGHPVCLSQSRGRVNHLSSR